jgi:hypothetical protein
MQSAKWKEKYEVESAKWKVESKKRKVSPIFFNAKAQRRRETQRKTKYKTGRKWTKMDENGR